MVSDSVKISLVVPVRNRGGIIGRTLDSIAAQTCRDFKLIIVDNASTDNTAEIIGQWIASHKVLFPSVTFVSFDEIGSTKARNRGLEIADTEYVMFFDSDDVMRPDHIRRIAEYLDMRPETDLLRWDISTIDDDGWLTVKKHDFHDEMQLNLLHGSMSTIRWIVRSECLRKAGGWNPKLQFWDDLELGVRLLSQTPPLKTAKLHGEPTVVVYPQPDSITGSNHHSNHDGIDHALSEIEERLTETGDSDYLNTLAARRAIIAGIYANERHKDLAVPMMEKALRGQSFKNRIVLRLINLSMRIFNCGGSAIALYFFGKKAEKR